MYDSMKRLSGVSLLLAVLISACSAVTPDVDFCRVLIAAPEYEGRTFKTEIIVVPDRHGRFATSSQCNTRAIKFANGSFAGSPALQNLDDVIEKAYLTRDRPPPRKVVDVRVTAQVQKVWFTASRVASPKPGYALRLLDADVGRLVDVPWEIVHGTGPEPSRGEKPRWAGVVQDEASPKIIAAGFIDAQMFTALKR
jgi:hypothetical protein